MSNEIVLNPVSQTSFTKNHALYDVVRPGYPDDAVQFALKVAKITDKSNIVEIAAGTGKFTAALRKFTNATITAVEPSPGMLETFRKNFPDITAIESPAGNIPDIPSDSADAIFVAQGFHWFANHESLKEFDRILKPSGVLVLVWNFEAIENLPHTNWQYRTVHMAWSLDKDVPQYTHNEWPKAFSQKPILFEPLQEHKFYYDKLIPSREFYWDYWKSRSYITALPVAQQNELEAKMLAAIDDDVPAGGPLTAKRGTHIVWSSPLPKST